MAVAERNAPGIAEFIRMKSMEVTDRAMLSRGVSVIRGTTLIVNLPGSPDVYKRQVTYIPDFLGEEYLFYTLPKLTVALLRATTADEDGNLTYEKECMPCEPLDLAMAAKAAGAVVIAQVERVAATGTLDPRDVKVPGILVDYVCVAEHPERIMQTHITHFNPAFTGEIRIPMKNSGAPLPLDDKKVFTRRTAMEIHAGDKCNLGIGMPGLVPNVLMEEGVDSQVTLISCLLYTSRCV